MVRDFPYPDWALTHTSLGSKNGLYLTHRTRLTNASKVLSVSVHQVHLQRHQYIGSVGCAVQNRG